MAIGSTIKISLDSKEVSSGIASMQESFEHLSHVVEALGIYEIGKTMVEGIIEAGKKIGETVLQITEIGEAASQSEKRLAHMVENTGLFGKETGEVTEKMLEYGNVMARNLGIDHQSIQLTESKLLTFHNLAITAGRAGGAFERATKACYDLAANGMGDAETAAIKLGKMMEDPLANIKALSRAGITFTAAEKDKIKTLMDTNQAFAAQDLILSTIEKKVGGTAAATATASGKLKEMKAQVIEAFAKPFADGFDEIPGKMTHAFDSMIKIASQWGKLIGAAISDSINGNNDKFIAIGTAIGKLIEVGVMATLEKAGDEIVRWASESKWGAALGIAGQGAAYLYTHNRKEPTMKELWDQWSQKVGLPEAMKTAESGTQGFVPGTDQKWKYDPSGESPFVDRNGNKIVEVLTKIEKNTEEGSKM